MRDQQTYAYTKVEFGESGLRLDTKHHTEVLTTPEIERLGTFYNSLTLSMDHMTPSLVNSLKCIHEGNLLKLEAQPLALFAAAVSQYERALNDLFAFMRLGKDSSDSQFSTLITAASGALLSAVAYLYNGDDAGPKDNLVGLYTGKSTAPAALVDWVCNLAQRSSLPASVNRLGYTSEELVSVVTNVITGMMISVVYTYVLHEKSNFYGLNAATLPNFSRISLQFLEEALEFLSEANTPELERLRELIDLIDTAAKLEGIIAFYGSTAEAFAQLKILAGKNGENIWLASRINVTCTSIAMSRPLK